MPDTLQALQDAPIELRARVTAFDLAASSFDPQGLVVEYYALSRECKQYGTDFKSLLSDQASQAISKLVTAHEMQRKQQGIVDRIIVNWDLKADAGTLDTVFGDALGSLQFLRKLQDISTRLPFSLARPRIEGAAQRRRDGLENCSGSSKTKHLVPSDISKVLEEMNQEQAQGPPSPAVTGSTGTAISRGNTPEPSDTVLALEAIPVSVSLRKRKASATRVCLLLSDWLVPTKR